MSVHRLTCKVLAPIYLAVLSSNSLAAEAWHSSTVKMLYPLADGSFVVIFDISAAACTNSNADKYQYVTPSQNGMTVEGAKKLYAAAMMALAMDKTVHIAFDDAMSYCYINRLTVVK